MFGFLTPPNIPEPVKPEDFTAAERRRYRDIAVTGDPLRDTRDAAAMDRILTNSTREITGPTGAFTLAQRERADDMAGRQMADYMGQSSQLEERRRDQAEEILLQMETQRQMDLDEYEQQVQAQKAAEEVARKNWQAGMFRAGVGLASVAAPGINKGISAIANKIGGGDDQYVPEYRKSKVGFGAMSESAGNRLFENAFMKDDDLLFGSSNLAIPGIDEMDDPYGIAMDPTRPSVLGY